MQTWIAHLEFTNGTKYSETHPSENPGLALVLTYESYRVRFTANEQTSKNLGLKQITVKAVN